MQNFKDDRMTALAVAQEITTFPIEEIFDMDECFGELEEVLHRVNSRFITQKS